jgi:hypothetical protein
MKHSGGQSIRLSYHCKAGRVQANIASARFLLGRVATKMWFKRRA